MPSCDNATFCGTLWRVYIVAEHIDLQSVSKVCKYRKIGTVGAGFIRCFMCRIPCGRLEISQINAVAHNLGDFSTTCSISKFDIIVTGFVIAPSILFTKEASFIEHSGNRQTGSRCQFRAAGRRSRQALLGEGGADGQEIPPGKALFERRAQQVGRVEGGDGADVAGAGVIGAPASAELADAVGHAEQGG
jgi:hypothetical protein